MRKLIKPWNKLPAGASVTTNPAEQVVLVDKDRLALLEKEGHLVPNVRPEMGQAREIPSEVRTSGSSRIHGRPIDENGGTEFSRQPLTPGSGKGHNDPPATPRPDSAPVGQGGHKES